MLTDRSLAIQRFLYLHNRENCCITHRDKHTVDLSCSLFRANTWLYIVFRTPHKSFMKWLIVFSIEKSGFIASNWALSSYKVGGCLFFFLSNVDSNITATLYCWLGDLSSALVCWGWRKLNAFQQAKVWHELQRSEVVGYATLSHYWRFIETEVTMIPWEAKWNVQ